VVTIVSYARWRAWWAILTIIAVVAFFALDAFTNPAGFAEHARSRSAGIWIGAVGVVWWVAVLWPDALRLLSSSRSSVTVASGMLNFADGECVKLSEISNLEAAQRPLRHPHVLVFTNRDRMPKRISTAFQPISTKTNPESIIQAINLSIKASI
jgi:hypothetical protein